MTFEGAVGQWWLAGLPQDAWAGWVDLDCDGQWWRLILNGSPTVAPEIYSGGATFHGRTGLGDFTLTSAHFTRSNTTSGVTSEVWQGAMLLKGGHVVDDRRFDSIAFELPSLIEWVGPGALNHHNRPPIKFDLDGELNIRLAAQLPTEERVQLAVLDRETFGKTKRSKTVHATYVISEGVTLERAERIGLALSRLHAILTNRPASPFSISLTEELAGRPRSLEVINIDDDDGNETPKRGDAFLDTSDIDFEYFIPRWFALHEDAIAAVAAAAPDEHGGYTTTRLMNVCNGLEHLTRRILPEADLTAKEVKALDLLKSAGITSDLRRTIRQTFLGRHQTLEMKLVAVAESIGHDSARWLLGEDLHVWAYSVARFRNALAHGLELKDGMVEDIPFTITALRSVTSVLRLALLVEAGYTAASGTPGELLWSHGQRVVAHPNSELWWELEEISGMKDRWQMWMGRIDPRDSGT